MEKLSKDMLRYGNIIDYVDFELINKYITIRVVEYNGKTYEHRMENGKVAEIKELV